MISVSITKEDGQPVDLPALNPNRQTDWRQILDNSKFTPSHFIRIYDIKESSFFSWLRCDSTPREKNYQKMVDIMAFLLTPPCRRIERHPSYGYATPEQIEKLQSLGTCPEREQLLSKIAKQNEKHGKTK